MLLNIHVKNIALIQEVEVDFSPNLNILTGETGAGKSIIIGSINTALGAKTGKDIIRKGADYALVELFFQLSDEGLIQTIKDLDIPIEDGLVSISRRIMPARSVSRINGELVTRDTLKTVAAALIDIHGQHEHQSLLHKSKHLEILDRFAKEEIEQDKVALSEAFSHYSQLSKEKSEALMDEETRLREMAFIEYELEEISGARLVANEDEILQKQYHKMSHSRQIVEALGQAHQLTGDDQGAAECIGRAIRAIGPVENFDDTLGSLTGQLVDIEALLNDFNREISGYMADMTFDDEAFAETEQRLDLINGLKARYGDSIESILAYAQKRQLAYDKLKDYEHYLEDLEQRFSQAESQLSKLCKKVSRKRKAAAEVLVKRITQALIDLNFLEVRFDMYFEPLDHFTKYGTDEVEFCISTNPGEDLKPLGKVASGGELSRIMLAIKSVLADADEIETLIFDEIDTGISGRTAQKVAEKMAVIAKKHQVISITHLPQIAAMADNHYIIEKSVEDTHTTTSIYPLDTEDAVVGEIARLLGGVEITETVLKSAREMKQLAADTKK